MNPVIHIKPVENSSYPRIGTIRFDPKNRVIHALELYGLRIRTICKVLFFQLNHWLENPHIFPLVSISLPVVRGLLLGENHTRGKAASWHKSNQCLSATASNEFHAPLTWQNTRPEGLLSAHVGLSTAATLKGLAVQPMVIPIRGAMKSKNSSAERRGHA